MIESFADKQLERLWRGERTRFPTDLEDCIANKLWILDAAIKINELRIPPSNRLEALLGNRAGQFSIRINRQWRLCFRWKDGSAYEVEVTDYH